MRVEQLRGLIEANPGTWDGKRALATYRELGFDCTLQRARVNLRMVAERYPSLLTKVEGTKWTYSTPAGSRTDNACPTCDGTGDHQIGCQETP